MPEKIPGRKSNKFEGTVYGCFTNVGITGSKVRD